MRKKLTFLSQALSEARAIASESNARSWLTLFDVISSGILLGASPSNYRYFGFGETPWVVRRSLLTWRDNQRLIASLNGPKAEDMILDKWGFAKSFSAHTGRMTRRLDQMDYGDLATLLAVQERVVIKPRLEAQGRGVRILDLRQPEVVTALLVEHGAGRLGSFLIEEALDQHPELTRAFGPPLHPLRIVTIKRGEDYFAWFAIIFIGVEDPVVNVHRGALTAAVDLKGGIICSPGLDSDGHLRSEHPLTGERLVGTPIPFWPQVLDLLGHAVSIADEAARYIGWDIGITPAGPVLIEGNETPGSYKTAQHRALRAAALGGKGLKEFQGLPLGMTPRR